MRIAALALVALLLTGTALADRVVWPRDYPALSMDDTIDQHVSAGDSLLVEAGSYNYTGTESTTDVTIRPAGSGALSAGNDITIMAKDGRGTVTFVAAGGPTWVYGSSVYRPTGWTIKNITFDTNGSLRRGVDIGFLHDWTYDSCDWVDTSGGTWNFWIAADNSGQANTAHLDSDGVTFVDCTFDGSTTNNTELIDWNGWVNNITFRRCTFDTRDMTMSAGTIIPIQGGHDVLFEDCEFFAQSTLSGDIFAIQAQNGTGGTDEPATTNSSGNVDVIRCTFNPPTTMSGNSYVYVKFTDGADSCDIRGSAAYGTGVSGDQVQAFKWEDAASTAWEHGFTEYGEATGNLISGTWLGILFGEKARGIVASNNYIIGTGSDSRGIWFQDARYCVATNNTIRDSAPGILFDNGDLCDTDGWDDNAGDGDDFSCNYGNVATGNWFYGGTYAFQTTADGGGGSVSNDSTSVRGGNIFYNIGTNIANVGGVSTNLATWKATSVPGLASHYPGWSNGVGSDSYGSSDIIGQLRRYGFPPVLNRVFRP